MAVAFAPLALFWRRTRRWDPTEVNGQQNSGINKILEGQSLRYTEVKDPMRRVGGIKKYEQAVVELVICKRSGRVGTDPTPPLR